MRCQCRRSNISSTDLLNNHFNNVTCKDLANVIYDGSRLKWCSDLTSLKTFVTEVLCQSGKWCSPGGYSKKFISSNAELTLTWNQGKQNTLLFQGKDGNLVRDKFVSLCQAQSCTLKLSYGQEQALSIDSEISMPTKVLSVNQFRFVRTVYRIIQLFVKLPLFVWCSMMLMADVKGVKLDITILQSRIELSESNNELPHKEKDKEIDRLRVNLCLKKGSLKG